MACIPDPAVAEFESRLAAEAPVRARHAYRLSADGLAKKRASIAAAWARPEVRAKHAAAMKATMKEVYRLAALGRASERA